MQTWTQQPAGNDALDAGRTVDVAHARNGDAGRVLIVDDDASVRPVIFLSGEVGPSNAQPARALGAVAYWTKPFDPRALATFVAREISVARAGSCELPATAAA